MSVYIIAQLKFTRRELYDRYQGRFFGVFRKFKGKVLVADERPQVLEGAFEKARFLQLLRYFIVFEDEGEFAGEKFAGK